uniref:Putative secreted protein n=1 Tax=Anopheles darlingi TaxID=43151 RepID=A0A2M4D279_ANODA
MKELKHRLLVLLVATAVTGAGGSSPALPASQICFFSSSVNDCRIMVISQVFSNIFDPVLADSSSSLISTSSSTSSGVGGGNGVQFWEVRESVSRKSSTDCVSSNAFSENEFVDKESPSTLKKDKLSYPSEDTLRCSLPPKLFCPAFVAVVVDGLVPPRVLSTAAALKLSTSSQNLIKDNAFRDSRYCTK